jgi:hypothetical protein
MLSLRRKKKFGGITVAGVRQKEEKNRGSQLLVIAAVLVTVLGGLLILAVDQLVGLVLLVGGLVPLFLLAVWAIRNWDWER